MKVVAEPTASADAIPVIPHLVGGQHVEGTSGRTSPVYEPATGRQTGRLPFPRFTPERLSQIEDTLDYPPRGSPEANGEIDTDPCMLEGLSAEPLSVDEDGDEKKEAETVKR